ncbi:MAG: hypothetical protein I8H75_04415 [Myxococcaceae bacterium]|nr:hypothetical protein [Myxococcaceae bacterium]MBH2006567.1 hypothetical protein [Myxococcaceae bacterium]
MMLINAIAAGALGTVFMVSEMVSMTKADCFEDWSRCTAWSSGLGGYLWQTCPQRCHCLGYDSGYCAEVPNTCSYLPAGSTVSRCHCHGTRVGQQASWCGF